jgi:Ca2+-binding RTX toxin-like protein
MLVAASVLLPAGAAQAGTLDRFVLGPFSSWTYTADSDANTVTISPVGSTDFRLTTTADTITIQTHGQCFNDPLCGCTGDGTSTVQCPKLRDLIVEAGSGNDIVSGDLGSSSPLALLGEGGVDQLTGGSSADVIDGGSGNDAVLAAGGGNDVIRGGTGSDIGVNGGSGTDTFSYNDGRATGVTASLAGTNSDNDGPFTSVEVLEGSANADTLTGTAGANIINGAAGNDVLIGAAGADTLGGGDGADTASYGDGRTTSVTASLAGGNTDNDVYSSIENLTGGLANDTLSGDAQHNVLDGGAGDDQLRGAGDQDDLLGGPGRDLASYEEQAAAVTASLAAGGPRPDGDTFAQIEGLRGGGGDDTLIGDDAENRLEGGPGDDLLIGAGEDDDLIGGGGRNTASYEERATPVAAGLQDAGPKPDSDTYVEIQSLRGGAGNDTLTGDDAPNTLDGGHGADALTGLAGIDELRGADGDDTVNAVDGSPDAIDCGDGADGATVETFDSVAACEAVTVVGAIVPPPDRDGDGYTDGLDCNDFDAAVRPSALEIPGNDVDENCDKLRPDFPLIGSAISVFIDARKRWTRITEVVITGIVPGGIVEARCRPPKGKRKACPFKLVRRSFPNGRRKLLLTGIFKQRRLPVGTVIEIRALGPNVYGKVRIEKIAKSKTKRRTLCLRPGATKLTRCPL